MAYWSWSPAPPLSHFVEHLFVFEGEPQPHTRERMLPTGTMQLIIDLNHDAVGIDNGTGRLQSLRGSVICGAYSEPYIMEPSPTASIVGASFKPGGVFPFLDLPAGELHGESVELATLWPSAAAEIRERLLELRTPDERARTLAAWLLERAVRPLVLHPAVGFALGAFDAGDSGVTEVTDRIGLSPRRFIELFRNAVGLTPKLFCRVRRFQSVLGAVQAGPSVDWIDLAYGFGYYDQAHFIHDFRAFSGMTPTAYLAHRPKFQNHVPLP